MWDKVRVFLTIVLVLAHWQVFNLQDDKVSMDFVVAAANLRAHVFGIQKKSRFDIKCMYMY